MRNMNSRGFTLVELIATILLLSIISIISFVAINGVIDNNQISNCQALVNNIEMATKEYVSDHRYDDGFSGTGITVKTLIDNNYLTGPIYDPFNNDATLNVDDITLSITFKSNYTVSSVKVMSGGALVDCDVGKW